MEVTVDNLKKFYESYLKKFSIENILIIRFPIKLNNVELKNSNIHGRGVFATKHIKSGEVITLYPGDLLNNKISNNNKLESFCQAAVEYAGNNNLLIQDYCFEINKTYRIYGCPNMVNDPAYLGHMCNDGADGSQLKNIYENISKERCNAEYKNIIDCCIAIIAINDINIGDEILVTYGYDYWIERHINK